MQLTGWQLSYDLMDAGDEPSHQSLYLQSMEGIDMGDLRLDLVCYEGMYAARLYAKVPIVLESFQLFFSHRFQSGDLVLMNGYQSWTDTRWLGSYAWMRGLDRVQTKLLERYALDAMGDNRFVDYVQRPGCQHGFSFAMVRDRREAGGGYHFLGSLDEERGFTVISMDGIANLMTVEPELPWRIMRAGESIDLGCWMSYDCASEDEAFAAWFAAMDVKARPVPPLLGYSSWYRHYGEIDEKKLANDLAGARSAFQKLDYMGLPDNARIVFQIDDGWCRIGDWLEPDPVKFPRGMAALAQDIRDAGFIPGLWHSPFVCEADSRLHREHPDWLLRDGKGEPIKTGPHWSGAYALDVLNPQVAEYAAGVLRAMVEDWGYGFVKLDFLYAACILPRKGMTRGRIMREAMQLLRDAAGDALLDACGVPLASAFGLADYCRIGCDVGLDWDDKLHMRLLHRERVSSKNALNNVLSRAGLDGRAFGNDPDVIFLRQDVDLSQAQKEDLLFAAANYGSMLLTSDDMGEWREEQDLSLYQAAVYVLCKRKEARA